MTPNDARAEEDQGIEGRRVDLPSEAVGFAAPPSHVRARLVPVGPHTALIVLTDPGKTAAVARWLEQYRPALIRIAPGIAPKRLTAEFTELPDAWGSLLSSVNVKSLDLLPSGTATLFLEDTRDRIENFLESLAVGRAVLSIRKPVKDWSKVRLTPRQMEVVAHAVALGYYELPHRIHLRGIAKKMGLGVGSTSELLRRGEAQIVKGYFDSLEGSRWDAAAPDKELEAAESEARVTLRRRQGMVDNDVEAAA
jgi:hypothetical protein